MANAVQSFDCQQPNDDQATVERETANLERELHQVMHIFITRVTAHNVITVNITEAHTDID